MAGAVLGGLLIGCDDDPAAPVEEDPVADLVETIRDATQAYHDVDAAIAAGFEQASPCVESPAGGMGFHYGRMASVDATLDAADPEILLYEPIEGGGLRLVGIEFLVLSEPWDAANAGAPSLVDESFDDHRDPDLWHGLPFPHYEFHVWAWEENPSGLFTPFNPAVSC
jgi:hypothetical protein